MNRARPSHPALSARVASLAPELRLVLATSHPAPDRDGQQERIAALCQAGMPWDGFLGLVRRHGVAGLAAATLAGNRAVPAPVLERLRQMAFQVAGNALKHTAELARLNAAFAHGGIDLMPLKGPALSQRLYGSPARRHCVDLDVLVRLDDLARAEALMEREGYLRIEPGFTLTPRLRAAVLEQAHDFHYRHPLRLLHVELHWGQTFWSRKQIALVWDRRIRLAWLGAETQEPDDDALLLLLCSHGARHAWSRGKWLADIAAILARPRRPPWDGLFQLTDRLGQTMALAQAAVLVRELYQTPLPEPLERFAGTRAIPGFVLDRPLANLQGGPGRESFLGHAWKQAGQFRYWVWLNRGVPLRAHLKSWMFFPSDTAGLGIPDRWFCLHYLLRPLLWLRRRLGRAPARLH